MANARPKFLALHFPSASQLLILILVQPFPIWQHKHLRGHTDSLVRVNSNRVERQARVV